jgi:probable phosphoglycerate mutase
MRDLAKQCRDAHTPSLVTYSWIPRDENSHADRLANKALDGESAHKPAAVIQQNYLTDRLRSAEIPTFIYFIRHGETVLTPTRKFSGTGSLDPELMQDGLDQADLVAEEAAKLGADVLIASPLKRTTQTAQAIARTTGLEIIFDESWYELSFGDWDGKSIEEVKAEDPDAYQAWLNSTAYAPGGGESYDDASIRIEEALEKLVAQYPGKKVIVVTHNGVIKTAIKLAMGAPAEAVFHVDATPCSISSISIWPSDGLRAVRSVNERGHLR